MSVIKNIEKYNVGDEREYLGQRVTIIDVFSGITSKFYCSSGYIKIGWFNNKKELQVLKLHEGMLKLLEDIDQ